jgi:hypothetical protein
MLVYRYHRRTGFDGDASVREIDVVHRDPGQLADAKNGARIQQYLGTASFGEQDLARASSPW